MSEKHYVLFQCLWLGLPSLKARAGSKRYLLHPQMELEGADGPITSANGMKLLLLEYVPDTPPPPPSF